ncbi:four-helix bundle copper-binding protein [Bdellovibrio sp. NC01]|uniref:four-helix bundle copper-binding protein n=1 Tax=Bdellovibrio sp. NC01 TaxID=2220073 RepID=UPI00115A16A6|nr:four-helix bundle copper-binding protein [Bdellovibrio sp. NC01]QDK38151.1 hypothetical protein DOE51_11430 [Bdellovibrio sp. NC01]
MAENYSQSSLNGQHEHETSAMQQCIDNCTECSHLCLQLVPHCLDMGGEHASSEHISILQICSLICETSAKLMTLDSEFHHDLCRLCAEVCKACATDCERLAQGDEMMIDCVEVCRRCAESCERMSAH